MATPNKFPTHVMELPDGTKQAIPLHGPFGDKALHGSKLVTRLKRSDPTKRNPPEEYTNVFRHTDGVDYWAAQCWAPSNITEAKKFADTKPDTFIDLVTDALATDAGQISWRAVRGNGALTLYVSVDGGAPSNVAKPLVDMLKTAGHKVVEVERKRKNK